MELGEDFKAVLPDPTFSRSLQSSFESNVIGSAIYMGMDAIAAGRDTTPVSDADIEDRIAREKLDGHISAFTSVTTRGELDTKVERIQRQLFNKRVGEAGGGQGIVTDLIAGALDITTLIPFGAALKPGMTAKQAVPRFAGAAAADAVVTEAALSQTLNETYEPGAAVYNIAGSVVLGSLLGAGASKLLKRADADKMGAGLARESDDVLSGKMAADAADLEAKVLADAREINAARLRGGSDDVIDGPTARGADDAPDAVSTSGAVPARVGDIGEPAPAAASRSADETVTVKQLTDLLGEPPTPTQIALANTLGGEQLARYGSKLFGASIPLEMMASTAQSTRRFANGFFMMRGNLQNNVTADTSIMGAKGVISGLQGVAKDGIVNSWREWSRDLAGGRMAGAYGRLTSDDVSLETFSDLVYRAVAHGDLQGITDPAMREALSHKSVQSAAKAYKKFDEELFSREVEAGLISTDAKRSDHVRHIYDQVQLLAKKDKFVQTETTHAFNAELAKATTSARTAREKSVAEAIEFEVRERERTAKNYDKGHDKAERDSFVQADKWLKKQADELDRAFARNEKKQHAVIDARTDAAIDVALDRAERQAAREFKIAPRKDGTTDEVDAVLAAERDARASDLFERMRDKIALENADARQKVTDTLTASRDLAMEKFNAEYGTRQTKAFSDAVAKLKKDRHTSYVNAERVRVEAIEAAEAAYGKATGQEAQNELLKWAKSHAEGVHTAAAHGRRSIIDGAPGGTPTGGNVRGGRQARNVYTPTRTLLDDGWLDTDLLKVIDRQTREDGMDTVLANKYRRAMSDEERKLLEKGADEAYWKHGKDPYTVPDLELREVRREIVEEYKELAANATTVKERKALAKERDQMLQYVEESVSGARGLDGEGSISGMLNAASAVAKSANFALYMGGSLITNTVDAGRVIVYHGLGNTMQYFGMRMGEKFRSGVWNDVAKAENQEMAQAAGFALNHVNFGRTSMAMGLTDPYAMSTRESGAANFAAYLTRVGGQMFGINWWNNKTQEIGYSMSQFRLSKLAVAGDISALPRRDQEWLRYIGVDQDTLTSFKDALGKQGVTEVTGSSSGRIKHTLMDREVQDKFVSAMQKDVTTMIVNPDHASLPRAFRNPVWSAVLQFQSFAMEAAQAVTMRDGGRLREGDSAAVIQGMFTLMAGSLLAYYLTGAARSGVDALTGRNAGQTELDKRVKAWSESPAQLFYQVFDYSGLTPMLTNVNNLFEGFTGVGMKEIAKELDGGKRIGASSTRTTPMTGEARVMNVLGPTARTLKEASGLVGDTLSGQFSQQTAQNALKLTPFASTFYLRNALENGVDAMGAAVELKKKSNRGRPLQGYFRE